MPRPLCAADSLRRPDAGRPAPALRVLFGTFLFVASGSPLPALELTIDPSGRVGVTGATSGGSVALAIAGREAGTFPLYLQDAALLADDDGDGVVSWSPDVRVLAEAVTVAIDVVSGQAASAGHPGAAVENPDAAWTTVDDGTGGVWVQIAGAQQHLLLVRPGAGAWSSTVSDGGGGDADAIQDGWTSLGPASVLGLDAGPTPATPFGAFATGDVVIAIDPRRLTWSAAVVDLSSSGSVEPGR